MATEKADKDIAVGSKRTFSEATDADGQGATHLDSLLADPSLHLCIYKLRNNLREKKLISLLQAMPGVEFAKLKKPNNMTSAHIHFADAEQKEKTLRVLINAELDGKKVAINVSTSKKKQRTDEKKDSKPRTVVDATTPWWDVAYEHQISRKTKHVVNVLRKITTQTRRDCAEHQLPQWLKELPTRSSPCCKLLEVRESPVKENYRNKVELSVGMSKSNEKTVGFLLGKFVDGRTDVGDAAECKILSPRAEEIRLLLQTFIRASPLPVFEKLTGEGFWRMVGVKTFSTGEGLITVQVRSEGMPAEEVGEVKKALVALFTEKNVTESLFFQEWNGTANFANVQEAPLQLLYGSGLAHEVLDDMRFRISPSAFFQVNTKGAEVLYGIVREWCAADADATVVDVCCGTGTIGLSMAKSVKKVIGIEMEPSAVRDAEENAKINGIENALFVVGKAEDVTTETLAEHATSNCIAVVDPPRSGLHPSVVKTIRACPYIKRLVYVSCDQGPLVGNASGFCRSPSRKLAGLPFRPVKAIAVDMFPLTPKVEVVMLLEREEPPAVTAEKSGAAKSRFEALLAKQRERLAAAAAAAEGESTSAVDSASTAMSAPSTSAAE